MCDYAENIEAAKVIRFQPGDVLASLHARDTNVTPSLLWLVPAGANLDAPLRLLAFDEAHTGYTVDSSHTVRDATSKRFTLIARAV